MMTSAAVVTSATLSMTMPLPPLREENLREVCRRDRRAGAKWVGGGWDAGGRRRWPGVMSGEDVGKVDRSSPERRIRNIEKKVAYHSACMVATLVVEMASAIASAFSRVERMIRALTLIEAGATVRITSSASVN